MRQKLVVILSFMLIFSKLSFAESGWQFAIMLPVGASFSFYNVNFSKDAPSDYVNNYRKKVGSVGFDTGININAGYLITDGNKGISLLLDLGYSHDTFSLTDIYDNNGINVDKKERYTFESLSLGILPKFHYNNYAFGFGVGVKIPMYLTHTLIAEQDNVTTDTISRYEVSQMNDIMKNAVMTYIKLTFDYSFYVRNEIAVVMGAYIGTDFGIDLRGAEREYVDSRNLASFDLGVQLGLKFGQAIFGL